MEIKPWHISTPLGAVAGWAVTKKLYGKHSTPAKEMTGAVLGGGAGFGAGKLYEAATKESTKQKALVSDSKTARRDALNIFTNAALSGKLLDADESNKGLLNKLDPEIYNINDVQKKDAGAYLQNRYYKGVADLLRAAAEARPNYTPQEKQQLQTMAKRYEEKAVDVLGNAPAMAALRGAAAPSLAVLSGLKAAAKWAIHAGSGAIKKTHKLLN